MTSTLTDRYVWAASRSVPEDQRDEFARELRERIGDATDALLGDGHSPSDAEWRALTDLGDPTALAASYVDRPLHLIGPRYYLTWWRILKLVLAIAVPIASAAVLLANLLGGAAVGEAIVEALSVAFSVATGTAFWVTLVFALIERYAEAPVTEQHWTPDHLPSPSERTEQGRVGDLVGSVVFLTILAGAIFWQRTNSIFTDAAGDPIPFLDPDLWSFWVPWFLAILLLEVAFAVAVHLRGWNWPLAVANLALNAAFTVPAVWLLLNGRLLNPDHLDASGWPWGGAGDVILTILAVVLVLVAIWDVGEGVVKAARASGTMRT